MPRLREQPDQLVSIHSRLRRRLKDAPEPDHHTLEEYVSIHSRLRRRLKAPSGLGMSARATCFNPQPTPSPAEGRPPPPTAQTLHRFNPQPTPSPAEGGRDRHLPRQPGVSIHSRLRRRLKARRSWQRRLDVLVSIHSRLRRRLKGSASSTPTIPKPSFNPQPTPSPAEGARSSVAMIRVYRFQSTADSVAG